MNINKNNEEDVRALLDLREDMIHIQERLKYFTDRYRETLEDMIKIEKRLEKE